MESPIRIEASVVPKVSFASQQNSIPVLRELAIINEGNEHLDDVELSVGAMPAFSPRPTGTSSKWRLGSATVSRILICR